MNCNNDEEILKMIEKNKRCCRPCFGSTGPAGSNANFAACFCVDQMRNIIQQIITLYPDDNLIVAM